VTRPMPLSGPRPDAQALAGNGAPEAQAAGGMFMALTLILLTLVVYLFSLTLPDEPRRRAVHASLAKAFYFPGTDEDVDQAPKGPTLLLSPGRDALRALEAALAAHPEGGAVAWEGRDLVVDLPPARVLTGGGAVADPDGTLGRVVVLLKHTADPVRVEAEGLSDAVAVTVALLGAGAGSDVSPGRVSAVGAGSGDEVDQPRLRVVLVRAQGVL
jgi:hypothetical protein